MNDKEHISLTELQAIIRDSIFIAHPSSYWVNAEIAEYKVNQAGHAYIELIDKSSGDDSVKARIKAIIWSGKHRVLKPYFENSTGQNLTTGIRVLVRCTVEYHELYGLSLLITDIDPAYTAGEAAMKRREIIRQLNEEGVFNMNKEYTFPLHPGRIAVISSGTAAGYKDFVEQLKYNSFGFSYTITLFDSVMQGTGTESAIIESLDAVAKNIESFDIVVIVRGGGSKTDLAWFDNYNIAYHITQFPIPVITGIGHDIDISVADMVAWRNLKTPTAVAEFIVSKTLETSSGLENMTRQLGVSSREITKYWKDLLENSGKRLKVTTDRNNAIFKFKLTKLNNLLSINSNYALKRIGRITDHMISVLPSRVEKYLTGRRNFIALKSANLRTRTKEAVNALKHKTELMESTLALTDPVSILKRGYSITTSNGKVIRNMSEVKVGERMETILNKGVLKSTITDKVK